MENSLIRRRLQNFKCRKYLARTYSQGWRTRKPRLAFSACSKVRGTMSAHSKFLMLMVNF